ncbi:MAG TPA: DUF6011 domain-containing protein [Streptosporangiaceae bacterium]|nr:DUF6011 domain-containing protein [Streptosporangiaceae bacterium]
MSEAQPTRCLRCGRLLTAQASVSRGYGRTCRARITAAAEAADLTAFKAEQVEKAREAIADGAVIPTSRPAVYAVSSTDGTLVYITDAYAQTCTCKAGANGRRCWHLAATLVLDAAAPVGRAA